MTPWAHCPQVTGPCRVLRVIGPLRARSVPVLTTALLLIAGCDSATPGSAAPDPATPPPAVSAAPTPTFADLTRGDVRSAVKLRGYDAGNRSAVVEPIIFMAGDAFCETYDVDPLDPRCSREWTTEDSRTRITMPLAAKPEFFTWETPDGSVCIESPEDGGACPMTAKAFAAWAADSTGEMLAITVRGGVITRLAQIYTP